MVCRYRCILSELLLLLLPELLVPVLLVLELLPELLVFGLEFFGLLVLELVLLLFWFRSLLSFLLSVGMVEVGWFLVSLLRLFFDVESWPKDIVAQSKQPLNNKMDLFIIFSFLMLLMPENFRITITAILIQLLVQAC